MSVFPLKCAVQTYAWGKFGKASEVGRLVKSAQPDFDLKEDTPYAELWMGTHPKGPSIIKETGQKLSEWLTDHPEALGNSVRQKFSGNGELPFLFKILSVNKSLSIQAHPNKQHAEVLHRNKPDKYPDANHKPEMAIALTPFEGMCGFRPKEEILYFLKGVPEFQNIVGRDLMEGLVCALDATSIGIALKKCFTALMTCDKETVQKNLTSLTSRLAEMVKNGQDTSEVEGELVLRLNEQFPGDSGCFCVYFLNHMRLQPGEAMFLNANLPHAYLSGDCVECMACSDNVVRAGLTPKFIDVPVLCEMLDYTCKEAKDNLFSSITDVKYPCETLYNPAVPDFTVCKIEIKPKQKEYMLSAVDSASLLLVVQGSGYSSKFSMHVQEGAVIFISANEELPVSVKSDRMLMFRAFCLL